MEELIKDYLYDDYFISSEAEFESISISLPKVKDAILAFVKFPCVKTFHNKDTYTEKEVLTMLEDYGEHYRCHISQYCDQDEIMDPEEFFGPYKNEKNG